MNEVHVEEGDIIYVSDIYNNNDYCDLKCGDKQGIIPRSFGIIYCI